MSDSTATEASANSSVTSNTTVTKPIPLKSKIGVMAKVFSCVSYASTLEMVIRKALRERVIRGNMKFEDHLPDKYLVVGVLVGEEFSVEKIKNSLRESEHFESYREFEDALITWIKDDPRRFSDLDKYIKLDDSQRTTIKALKGYTKEELRNTLSNFLQILAVQHRKAQEWIIDNTYINEMWGFGNCIRALEREMEKDEEKKNGKKKKKKKKKKKEEDKEEGKEKKLPTYRNDLIHCLMYLWVDMETLYAHPCLTAAADCTSKDPCCPYTFYSQKGCAHHNNSAESEFTDVYEKFLVIALEIIYPNDTERTEMREKLESETKKILNASFDLQELVDEYESKLDEFETATANITKQLEEEKKEHEAALKLINSKLKAAKENHARQLEVEKEKHRGALEDIEKHLQTIAQKNKASEKQNDEYAKLNHRYRVVLEENKEREEQIQKKDAENERLRDILRSHGIEVCQDESAPPPTNDMDMPQVETQSSTSNVDMEKGGGDRGQPTDNQEEEDL